MYKKGDTFRLQSGKVVLVLNDGMTAEDFNTQYDNQRIIWVNMFNGSTWILSAVNDPDIGEHWLQPLLGDVCYNVLIGNMKGWVNDSMIEECKAYEDEEH